MPGKLRWLRSTAQRNKITCKPAAPWHHERDRQPPTDPHEDFVVVYLEAADVSGILQKMMDSTDLFHMRFEDAVLKECRGMDASTPLPPDNQTMIDLF